MTEISRPKWCPYQDCLPVWHTYDDDERLCWGRMPEKQEDKKYQIWNSSRHCEDGAEIEQINSADCLYFIQGYLACLMDIINNPEVYNPLEEVGVSNPLQMIEDKLHGLI